MAPQPRSRRPGGAAALAAAAALWLLAVAQQAVAQNTNSSGAASQQFSVVDTLQPYYAHLYGIPVAPGAADPDVLVTVTLLGPGKVDLYCNPGWGAYADVSTNFPQPGFAVWSSNSAAGSAGSAGGVDSVFISRNDALYRPPGARRKNDTYYAAYVPSFICSVINTDATRRATYRVETALITNSKPLVASQQAALASIYASCCASPDPSVCSQWKNYTATNNGTVFTDFCSYDGQICNTAGELVRLSLKGYNLQCPFPTSQVANLTALQVLVMSNNANLTGNLGFIFQGLHGLDNLTEFDVSFSSGLNAPSGGLAPSGPASGICPLADTLRILSMEGVGLNGSSLPACLFANGSALAELNLGNNDLRGSIPDVIPVNSPLEVLAAYNNSLSGPLPGSLLNASALSTLDLSYNNVSGSLPEGLGELADLKFVVLPYNNLTGAVPSSLARALNLETLDLKANRLSALPSAWLAPQAGSANSSLVSLRLSFNNIRGPFPMATTRLPALTFLVLNNNSFSGGLPAEEGMFPSLRALNLSNNQFSGTIPRQFGQAGIFNLGPLQYQTGGLFQHVFDLSNNRLTGTLPTFLAQPNLPPYASQQVLLSGNRLTVPCGNSNFSYITDVCVAPRASAAAAAPGALVSIPAGAVASASTPGGISVAGAPAGSAGLLAGASAQSASASSSGGGGSVSGGAIAGIVIGVAALGCVCVLVSWWAYNRYKRTGVKPMVMTRHNQAFERFTDAEAGAPGGGTNSRLAGDLEFSGPLAPIRTGRA